MNDKYNAITQLKNDYMPSTSVSELDINLVKDSSLIDTQDKTNQTTQDKLNQNTNDNKIQSTKENAIKSMSNDNDKLIAATIDKLENPYEMITAKEVAKDLKLGINYARDLFNRPDFPSINIGKTRVVCVIAYTRWKLERRV